MSLNKYGIVTGMRILQTKIHRPKSVANALFRPRLVKQLTAGMANGHPLLLVVAPAGFGKTTLVTTWLEEMSANWEVGKRPFLAWLSLERTDSDLNRFFRYLLAALAAAELPISDYLSEQLQQGDAALPDDLLIALLNLVTEQAQPMVLILEDFHLVQNGEIDKAVAFLLTHAPTHFHLVIVSRVEPNLPLSRLRTRQQMTEIRAHDMRFSIDEATQFFANQSQLALTTEQITRLEARTEGWAAGLQMASLSLQNQADPEPFVQHFAGSNRYVMDYLVDEVLHNLPEEMQPFLLQTAILNRFCASLCDAVVVWPNEAATNAPSSQNWLDFAMQANLFIVPLDASRRWFRYHHLFQDLLRQRLSRLSPEVAVGAHRRAASWLLQNGLPNEALSHAIAASDEAEIAAIGEAIARNAFSNGLVAEALHSILQAQEALSSHRAELSIYAGWLYAFLGKHYQISAIAPQQVEVDHGLINGRKAPSDLVALAAGLQGIIAALRKDDAQARAWYESGLAQLESDDNIVRHMLTILLGYAEMRAGESWSGFQRLLSVYDPAVYLRSSHLPVETMTSLNGLFDHPDGAVEFLTLASRVIEQAESSGKPPEPMMAWLYLFLGRDCYYRNELLEARRLYQKAADLGRVLGSLSPPHFAAQAALMRLHLTQGRHQQAEEIAAYFWGRVETIQGDVKELVGLQMRFLLEQKQIPEAQALADAYGFSSAARVSTLQSSPHNVYAAVLLAQDRFDDALPLLRQCLRIHKLMGLVENEVSNLLQIANALLGLNRQAQARFYLEQAVRIGAKFGYVRCFLEVDLAYLPLLVSLRQRAPDFVDQVLALLENGRFDPNAQLAEPLSPRELEILGHIAAGASNRDIADALTLSVGTIKKHAANIYGKLGVNSRTMAIAEARALGLLEK